MLPVQPFLDRFDPGFGNQTQTDRPVIQVALPLLVDIGVDQQGARDQDEEQAGNACPDWFCAGLLQNRLVREMDPPVLLIDRVHRQVMHNRVVRKHFLDLVVENQDIILFGHRQHRMRNAQVGIL